MSQDYETYLGEVSARQAEELGRASAIIEDLMMLVQDRCCTFEEENDRFVAMKLETARRWLERRISKHG